ncbi:MAG: hypothetical protein UY26_C0003G0300 [Candidatus Jorgensenbacteria bacterium GW2011_GWA1_48_13]|uniref:Uncharacterized protein n=2 Tax=Candidatus Joergenseniibacteriota TaxID=1752739 RepID=A0A0G1YII9_9BACT|nr:MAG: hypothetical protein UY26_C0003G0300 [Candidatus Jorgensenbacteria bacterium GW2011_GWA1_48_13]KKU99241.1 MAG: hypothetical protein UY32_C0003G0011 [Candidatus Jorgensenbacteria bacterium GW2011_GWC1_48_8]KKW14812.1 MAG: hypothetical protein UY55_C0003G0028 [Candidatus Jorgensenbacteria bacterium GW2011_GWB1_50_10]
MSKTNKILLVVVVVLVLALIGVVLWQTVWKSQSYYAVFMRTGDLYFGQLMRFPSFGLKQVYNIQVNTQNQENPVSIQRFKNVFWGPQDWLKLNRSEVVWMTKLDPAGQLAQIIKNNPDLQPQQGAQQTQAQPPAESGQ